jgi:hypothetical protein
MSPSLEGIGLVEKVSTVAVEARAIVLKLHGASKHLGIVVLKPVVAQLVGVDEVDTVLGALRASEQCTVNSE